MERLNPLSLREAEGAEGDQQQQQQQRRTQEVGCPDVPPTIESYRKGEHYHSDKTTPPPQVDVETETSRRTALEPTGFYSTAYPIENEGRGGAGQGNSDNNHEAYGYAYAAPQQEMGKNGLMVENNLPASVEDEVQVDHCTPPPWSHSRSRFPLPKSRLLKTSPPIEHVEQMTSSQHSQSQCSAKSTEHQKSYCRFDSFAELWAQKKATTLKLANSGEANESALSNENNDSYQKLGVGANDVTTTVNREREIIIKNKIRDDFVDTIAKDKVVIANDSSITGRYNTSRPRYQPHGFEPSTEEACKEEIYEVIKPSSTLCYTYYDNDDFQILLHKHYQSWDPKTMQYSPQPYNIFQPLCGNTQYPLTPSTNAAAGTRAALLSFMTKNNSSDNVRRYSGANITSSHTEDPRYIRDNTYNNDNNINASISSLMSRRDSNEAFGRRHSLYVPGPSFDAMSDFNFPLSSSVERTTSGNSSMGRARHFDNTFDDYAFSRTDTSTVEVADDLFRMGDNQFSSHSQSNTANGELKKSRGSRKRSQNTESSPTSKRRKNKTGRGTPNSAKRKKKKDGSPTRRSSRRRPKRDFDDDSSAQDSDR